MLIENPSDPKIQAIFLKMHCRLFAAGMKNSRLSGKEVLTKVSVVTGKRYKSKEYNIAIRDLQAVIDG